MGLFFAWIWLRYNSQVMIVYEVTAVVQPQFVKAYEEYMTGRHIRDVLDTGYFAGAEFARAEGGRYRIRYIAETQAKLDEYLINEAARLRADFAVHFPGGVELSREIWEVLPI